MKCSRPGGVFSDIEGFFLRLGTEIKFLWLSSKSLELPNINDNSALIIASSRQLLYYSRTLNRLFFLRPYSRVTGLAITTGCFLLEGFTCL